MRDVAFLVLGAVLGLILTVSFEDPLKALLHSGRRRLRRRRALGTAPGFSERFRLGPLPTGYVSVEGDGSRLITEENVEVRVEPVDVRLPEEFAPWRAEALARQEDRGNDDHSWNGPRYAVRKVAITRVGVEEAPGIRITLRHSDYLNFLTTQQLDRPLPDGTTPRSRYLDGTPIDEIPDFMSNSFGAHVAIVTKDNYLVFSRRSSNVSVQASLWSSSMSEGFSRMLDNEGQAPPNLYAVARRGLHEELGLSQEDYELRLLSVGLATTVHQWVGLFVARLDTLTLERYQAFRSRGVQDPWEHGTHEVVPFYPRHVLGYLLRADRRDAWTPMAPPLYYYALVDEFGRKKVEDELRDVVKATPRLKNT